MRKGRYSCYKVWCHLSNFSNTRPLLQKQIQTQRRRNPPFLFKKYKQLEDKNGRIFN